jgi:hypothetical protein
VLCLTDEDPPSPRVAATRRWRARERNGLIQLKVELDESALALALVDNGLLSVNRADDRKALSMGAQRILEDFIAGDVSRHDYRDRVKVRLLLAVLREKVRAAESRTRSHHRRRR